MLMCSVVFLNTYHIIWVTVVYGLVRGIYITQNYHMTGENRIGIKISDKNIVNSAIQVKPQVQK